MQKILLKNNNTTIFKKFKKLEIYNLDLKQIKVMI